jgi:hypothetical protein
MSIGKRKRKKKETLETFWFTVDNWFREYRFGINRHPWELSPDHYDEHDTITAVGRLRNKTRRKFERGELHLLASLVPRREWSEETERIGNAWVQDGRLCCSAWIPADVFHSLVPVFSANKFKQMTFTVSNLRYNKGAMESIRLACELTPLEEEDE